MESYDVIRETLNPFSGEWEDAIWHYRYKGHLCLIEFANGAVWNPYSASITAMIGGKKQEVYY